MTRSILSLFILLNFQFCILDNLFEDDDPGRKTVERTDNLYVLSEYLKNESVCQEPDSVRGVNRMCFRAGGSNMIYNLNTSSYISGTVQANTPLRCRCPEDGSDTVYSWYLYIPANASPEKELELVPNSYSSGIPETLDNYSAGEQFACMPTNCPSTRYYQVIEAVP
ncbi:hypothetical protein [Leptospira dzoumogneensis]|uniref:Uncharacterized protein n=1 Tax=Leptospira dzoumogneensis TaxID=2484904 RepID=A0A4Z1AII8_9LEPT|nr:hypothetical protein [Leptospira dzoumogneensis]TGN04226.1 hypothetical protein EHR06_00660 [Leptospira dzoumogneensis]